MKILHWCLLSIVVFIPGCSLFSPKPITLGHIPPLLTQPRIIYGCTEINNELKLAQCYLKTSEALYLANQDKESLTSLEKKWNE